ncbi:MAG: AAA family ATPase [Nitrososphaerales archaeon]
MPIRPCPKCGKAKYDESNFQVDENGSIVCPDCANLSPTFSRDVDNPVEYYDWETIKSWDPLVSVVGKEIIECLTSMGYLVQVNKETRTIIVISLPGAGKSTLVKIIAQRLGIYRFSLVVINGQKVVKRKIPEQKGLLEEVTRFAESSDNVIIVLDELQAFSHDDDGQSGATRSDQNLWSMDIFKDSKSLVIGLTNHPNHLDVTLIGTAPLLFYLPLPGWQELSKQIGLLHLKNNDAIAFQLKAIAKERGTWLTLRNIGHGVANAIEECGIENFQLKIANDRASMIYQDAGTKMSNDLVNRWLMNNKSWLSQAEDSLAYMKRVRDNIIMKSKDASSLFGSS